MVNSILAFDFLYFARLHLMMLLLLLQGVVVIYSWDEREKRSEIEKEKILVQF